MLSGLFSRLSTLSFVRNGTASSPLIGGIRGREPEAMKIFFPLSLALVAGAVASRRLDPTHRRLVIAAAVVIATGSWALVRTGGFSGYIDHEFAWRWATTAEERLLAQANDEPAPPPKTTVAASFYPLAEFARQVGGNRVEVLNITPAGVEPHEYEPAPQDVARVLDAQLWIFNGSGFDPWAERLVPDLERRGARTIDMSRHVERIRSQPLRAEKGAHGHGHHDHAHEGQWDPHYWLDPVLAQRQVEVTAAGLAEISPDDVDFFRANADRYISSLSELDRKYREGLRECESRTVVISHAAIGYLARRYSLTMVPIVASPEAEPSPRWLAEVSRLAREQRVDFIFFENLASPKLAETVAREIGAGTLVFHPIEGLTREELEGGHNYLTLMEENLSNLRLALKCK